MDRIYASLFHLLSVPVVDMVSRHLDFLSYFQYPMFVSVAVRRDVRHFEILNAILGNWMHNYDTSDMIGDATEVDAYEFEQGTA